MVIGKNRPSTALGFYTMITFEIYKNVDIFSMRSSMEVCNGQVAIPALIEIPVKVWIYCEILVYM